MQEKGDQAVRFGVGLVTWNASCHTAAMKAIPRHLIKVALVVNVALLAFAVYLIAIDDPAGWRNVAIPGGMLPILWFAGRKKLTTRV